MTTNLRTMKLIENQAPICWVFFFCDRLLGSAVRPHLSALCCASACWYSVAPQREHCGRGRNAHYYCAGLLTGVGWCSLPTDFGLHLHTHWLPLEPPVSEHGGQLFAETRGTTSANLHVILKIHVLTDHKKRKPIKKDPRDY